MNLLSDVYFDIGQVEFGVANDQLAAFNLNSNDFLCVLMLKILSASYTEL